MKFFADRAHLRASYVFTPPYFGSLILYVDVHLSIYLIESESKLTDTLNPFCDHKQMDFAQLIRGQLASCAAAHMESQFFVHTFSIFICRQSMRFIR